MDQFFPYELDRRFLPLWKVVGGAGSDDGVTITDDGRLVARIGRFRTEAHLARLRKAEATGPYRWWRAIGVRLSLADGGLTFGTNARRGACLEFEGGLPRVIGFRDHPALTVTVADVDGLLTAVGARR